MNKWKVVLLRLLSEKEAVSEQNNKPFLIIVKHAFIFHVTVVFPNFITSFRGRRNVIVPNNLGMNLSLEMCFVGFLKIYFNCIFLHYLI